MVWGVCRDPFYVYEMEAINSLMVLLSVRIYRPDVDSDSPISDLLTGGSMFVTQTEHIVKIIRYKKSL